MLAAFEARDWAAVRSAYAADAKMEDRRRYAQFSKHIDAYIADWQQHVPADVHWERQLVATAGNRVDIERVLWTGGVADNRDDRPHPYGPFEVEHLWLAEVDEHGRIVATVGYDGDDLRVAQRDACARWFAVDPVAAEVVGPGLALTEAILDRDRARVRAVLADDVVVHDHRPARLDVIEGAAAYVESIAAWWDLAPELHLYTPSWLAIEPHGSVSFARASGTLSEGGTFEGPMVALAIVADGRITRMEMWDVEHLDAALARFAELRPDPLRIPPNAASRARERTRQALVARDWVALRAHTGADFVFEDRTKRALLSGGVDLWIASMKQFASSTLRIEAEPIATFGDRIALDRTTFAGEQDGERWEMAALRLTEVGADGKLRAAMAFDLDDRTAAFDEGEARFAAGEAAGASGTLAAIAFGHAFRRHDLEALRECIADDAVISDRRALGLLTLGRDQWLQSVRTMVELAPDVDIEVRYLAWNDRGTVAVVRAFGTVGDGGPFETALVSLVVTRSDRFQHMEMFDVRDAEQALARFEELCSQGPSGSSSGRSFSGPPT
jgi:hypothetical protein